jgi:hypothetical protein
MPAVSSPRPLFSTIFGVPALSNIEPYSGKQFAFEEDFFFIYLFDDDAFPE